MIVNRPFYKRAAVLLAIMSASAVLAKESDRPNVIIIYGDDVGFNDVGYYGCDKIPTPNIDKLAFEGCAFIDGHSAAATCSPSRYSMLTGIHGFRDGVAILPPNAPLSISTDILTLPKLFKKAGYTTGVVGKWHLGIGEKGVPTNWNGDVKPGPLEIGFDRSFLLPSTNDRVPCVYLNGHRVVNADPNDPIYVGRTLADVQKEGSTQYPDGKSSRRAMTYYQSTHGHDNSIINGIGRIGYMSGGKTALWNDETMTDQFVMQAKSFITANKDKPFFLYFSSQSIHVPRAPDPQFHGATDLGFRGDAMVEFDWSVGQIMKELERHGLTKNTMIIFSSDNGPVYDDGYDDGSTVKTSSAEKDNGHDASGVWRGGKYQIYEGGTRVPLIIRWPARIKPKSISNALVSQIDFIASFAALLDIELADHEAPDSRNTLGAFLLQDKKGLPYLIEEAGRKERALRQGDWKYVMGHKGKNGKPREAELYDLASDPAEHMNMIHLHPEKAQKMDALLKKLMESDGIR